MFPLDLFDADIFSINMPIEILLYGYRVRDMQHITGTRARSWGTLKPKH